MYKPTDWIRHLLWETLIFNQLTSYYNIEKSSVMKETIIFIFIDNNINHQKLGVLLQIMFTIIDPPLHAWVHSLQQPFARIPDEVTLMSWVFQNLQMAVK